MALVLHLLAVAASPRPVASPIPVSTTSSGLNLLPILLAVLVVILLILIIALRMSGRQKQPPAGIDDRTPAVAPHTPADGENPNEREIYRAQPTPFATQPAAAGAPVEPPAPAAYPSPPQPQPLPQPAAPPPPAAYQPPLDPAPVEPGPVDAPLLYPPTTLAPWTNSPAAPAAPMEPPPVRTPEPFPAPIPPGHDEAPFGIDPAPPPRDPFPDSPSAPFAFPTTTEANSSPAAGFPEAPAPVPRPGQPANLTPIPIPPPPARVAPPPVPEAPPSAEPPIPVVAPEPVAIERPASAAVVPPPIIPVPSSPTPIAPEPVVPAVPEPPPPPAEPVAAAAASAPAASAAGDRSLILLIEDDERIAKFYSILFEAKGYAVQNARDGVEGVDMATTLKPALILLDVMMPKMNGLMVLQTLRANPDTEHTPVVVLSNYMEPPLIQRALQLGAIEYVVKSQARPEQLVNAVPSWLRGEPALH